MMISYQLTGTPTLTPGHDLYVFDIDDITPELVTKTHNLGAKIYAYFSAGTAEKWRSDYKDFPTTAFGKAMKDWPDERWMDISKTHRDELYAIMRKRIDRAFKLGCDGIDPDNMDAYDNAKDAGLNLTQADSAAWLKKLVVRAHKLGMGCTLKNSVDLIPKAVALGVDVYINEEAGKYNEASAYRPALKAGKPVFCVEYQKNSYLKKHLPGMQVVLDDLDLKAPVIDERMEK